MKGSAFGPKHAHQRLPVSSLFAENLDYVALPLASFWRYRVSLLQLRSDAKERRGQERVASACNDPRILSFAGIV